VPAGPELAAPAGRCRGGNRRPWAAYGVGAGSCGTRLVGIGGFGRRILDVARVNVGAKVVAGNAGGGFDDKYQFGRKRTLLSQPVMDDRLSLADDPAERDLRTRFADRLG